MIHARITTFQDETLINRAFWKMREVEHSDGWEIHFPTVGAPAATTTYYDLKLNLDPFELVLRNEDPDGDWSQVTSDGDTYIQTGPAGDERFDGHDAGKFANYFDTSWLSPVPEYASAPITNGFRHVLLTPEGSRPRIGLDLGMSVGVADIALTIDEATGIIVSAEKRVDGATAHRVDVDAFGSVRNLV